MEKNKKKSKNIETFYYFINLLNFKYINISLITDSFDNILFNNTTL
ncbi:hypothetical protein PROPEN_02725 [Proteus penneri ATCC 35198]|nr:hypothetical protein PROPEN_02725 [Proteus penneri ATCC 35198]